MSAFVWRLWRLGFARFGVVGILGWRRLWWRFWWLLPPPRVVWHPVEPEEVRELRPRRTVHWSALAGLPVCGAARTEWCTVELEYSTCPKCQEVGQGILLQHEVNTR